MGEDDPGKGDTRPLGDEEVAGSVRSATGLSSDRFVRGDRAGRYVVIGELGSGGMGVVYLAYDPELDRKVALKVLRLELLAGELRTEGRLRLQREAQAMARLNHPNVVTVHDVGTIDGRLFVAMEYVKGLNLEEWLQREPRGWQEIVRVYRAAGTGLAAAHAAGLVHRDFKPNNVMVGEDGRVRVLDFGLVHVLEAATSDEVSETAAVETPPAPDETGVVVGTPGYMAPEQWLGDPVDERSDQFSFCVALFEALYGRLPFPEATRMQWLVQADWKDLVEPPAGARVPAWLLRILRKGLAAEPQQRHDHMGALLAALAADPARRRRRIAAVAGAVVLAAVAVLGMLRHSEQESALCAGAEERLQGIWDADTKAVISAALLATGKPWAQETWEGVEQQVDDWTGTWVRTATEACEATRIRGDQSEALLDLRMACLRRSLAELAELSAQLATPDDVVLRHAVDAAADLPELEQCSDTGLLLAVVRPPGAAVAEQVAQVRDQLAAATALKKVGRYARAREVCDAAADRTGALAYPPLVAEARLVLADLLEAGGEMQEAATAYQEAATAAEQGHDDRSAARACLGLAGVLGRQLARYAEAERWLSMAEAKVGRIGGDAGLTADLTNLLGIVRHQQGRLDEALAAHHRSLELRRSIYGEDHPAVSVALINMGLVYFDLGRLEEARDDFEQALHSRERLLGPEHPALAPALIDLGNTSAQLGDGAAAEASYRRAIALYQSAFGPDHPSIAKALTNLAGVVANRDNGQALAMLDQALRIKRATFGDHHPSLAFTLVFRGGRLLQARRFRDAGADFEAALDILADLPAHPLVPEARSGLGEARLGLGRPGQAVEPLRQALEAFRTVNDPAESAWARFLLGRALWESGGDRERGLELARQVRSELAAAGAGRPSRRLAAIDAWISKATGGARPAAP